MSDKHATEQAKANFRKKAARVYRGSDEGVTQVRERIVDRGFTVRFTEQDKRELEVERSQIRERLVR